MKLWIVRDGSHYLDAVLVRAETEEDARKHAPYGDNDTVECFELSADGEPGRLLYDSENIGALTRRGSK